MESRHVVIKSIGTPIGTGKIVPTLRNRIG
jgi:amino acid permease